MMMRLLLAALALMTAPLAAPAQTYPDRAIRIVSGTQTGSSGDLAGRLLAVKLTAVFGQSVVFESRPGANGALAANYVKSLPPDGYGILFLASSTIISGPLMVKNVGFEALRDFTPISLAVAVPSYLVVNSSLAVDNVSSLIDYAKRNPGKLAYGSVGRGSAFHLIGKSFKLATGIDMLHVPYTGANNANIIGDLLNNRIQVYFPAYPAVLSALPTGQVKLLAVFQTARVKQLPQLPTVNETLPNNKIVPSWFGFMGPAGLPQPIATRLQEEIRKALADPEVTSKLEEVGIIPVGSTSSEMAEAIRAGTDDMSKLVKELGIEPQ